MNFVELQITKLALPIAKDKASDSNINSNNVVNDNVIKRTTRRSTAHWRHDGTIRGLTPGLDTRAGAKGRGCGERNEYASRVRRRMKAGFGINSLTFHRHVAAEMTDARSVASFLQDCAPHRFSARARERCARFLRTCARLQQQVCEQLQDVDGTPVQLDCWRREEGGGGATAILCGGNVFLKANVDVTMVTGKMPASALGQLQKPESIAWPWPEQGCDFLAIALSSVIHVKNPHVPSYHFNLRLILLNLGDGTEVGWYGGVIDITPFYLIPEDISQFHRTLKEACEKHDVTYYPRFKKWCDDYFFIRHRGETRGLGGIFFDNLTFEEEGNFEFARSCADAILPAYIPILRARVSTPFTDQENTWKLLRYGRYIEFNLMYDNGTKFGLLLPGFRTESLFASIPVMAKWGYNWNPEPGGREEELVRVLRCPQNWV